MSIVHTVEQGEHLPGIAARYGFLDYRHVWNDPANAELKGQRKSPNVLAPGDQVTIPDKSAKSISCKSEALHRFRVKAAPLLLRLVILDASGEPVPDADGELHIDGALTRIKTDGDGRIEAPIPATARDGRLVISNDRVSIDVRLGIGEMDPVGSVTGQIARLNNLGYDAGPVREPDDDAARTRLRSAIEEFQCDHKLTIDGACGPKTQDKLKAAHGC